MPPTPKPSSSTALTKPAAPSTALTTTPTLSSEDLTALLQKTGWAEQSSGPQRMKFDAAMLTTPDGGMYVYNPAKPAVPACTVRIVRPPEEYWAMWLSDSNAQAMSRPDLGATFSKRYVHPDPDRRVWDGDLAFDEIKNAGLFDEYGKPVKPSWKADILIQIIPDSGALQGDEPIYTLTLPTTSLIEFKGASRSPDSGSVSDKNFIRKLSEFALNAAAEAGTDPRKAVLDALTSLTLGGVAAEIRIVRTENKELGRTWSVLVFDPVHIEPMQDGDTALLGDGDGE